MRRGTSPLSRIVNKRIKVPCWALLRIAQLSQPISITTVSLGELPQHHCIPCVKHTTKKAKNSPNKVTRKHQPRPLQYQPAEPPPCFKTAVDPIADRPRLVVIRDITALSNANVALFRDVLDVAAIGVLLAVLSRCKHPSTDLVWSKCPALTMTAESQVCSAPDGSGLHCTRWNPEPSTHLRVSSTGKALLRSTVEGRGVGDATMPEDIEARASKLASIVLPIVMMQMNDDKIEFE